MTQSFGNEFEWDIGCTDKSCQVCSNSQKYGDNQEYDQECCLPNDKDEFSIKCLDAYGDGWHGGYLQINGIKYCEDFNSGFVSSDVMQNTGSGIDLNLNN